MKKILFSLFAGLVCTQALADYTPSVSTVRSISEIHVFKDWKTRHRFEVTQQVETDKGIAALGEQKLSYNSAHERIRVIKAYTIQPDGSIDLVRPESIRTQDDRDEDGDSTYSETKVKVIIFPNLKVGSKTYYKAESFQHTPDFPKQFEWAQYFSPHRKFKYAEVRFSHAPEISIQVDAKGMSGGKVVVDKPAANAPVSYQFTFTQDTAYPRESWMVSLSDFAPYFTASSFKSYAEVGQAYQARALPQTRITPEIRNFCSASA